MSHWQSDAVDSDSIYEQAGTNLHRSPYKKYTEEDNIGKKAAFDGIASATSPLGSLASNGTVIDQL